LHGLTRAVKKFKRVAWASLGACKAGKVSVDHGMVIRGLAKVILESGNVFERRMGKSVSWFGVKSVARVSVGLLERRMGWCGSYVYLNASNWISLTL
jgi:hypothetical protein